MLGAVLFFPLPLENHYTCLYHRLLQSEQRVKAPEDESAGQRRQNRPLDRDTQDAGVHEHHPQLLNHYLNGYAFLWWTSLLLLAAAFFKLKRMHSTHTFNGGTHGSEPSV